MMTRHGVTPKMTSSPDRARFALLGVVVALLGLLTVPGRASAASVAASSGRSAVPAVTVHPADLYLVDIFWIENYATEYCLAIPGGSTTPGTAAIQWPCETGLEQRWEMYLDTDYTATYEIVNEKTGQCLAVAHGSDDPGQNVIQWPCNNGTEQRWIILSAITAPSVCAEDYCQTFENYASGLCMAIPHGDKVEGIKVIQWNCENTIEQFWVPLRTLRST